MDSGDYGPLRDALARADDAVRTRFLTRHTDDAEDDDGKPEARNLTDGEVFRTLFEHGRLDGWLCDQGNSSRLWLLDVAGLWRERSVKQFCSTIESWLRGEERVARMSLSLKSRMDAHKIAAALKYGQAWAPWHVDPATFDQDPYLLGCPGGVVDLRTGVLRRGNPEDRITLASGFTPSDNADCPKFLAFLQFATGDDQGVITYLQQVFGQALIGRNSLQKLPYLYGPGGNGKGLLIATLLKVFGDYGWSLPGGFFIERHNKPHDSEVADLRGKRLAVAQETAENAAWDESRLKTLSGGDRVTASKKGKDAVSFEQTWQLALASNNLMRIKSSTGVDQAYRRRIEIVPFTRKPERVNEHLDQELQAEGPGILRWLIDGCLAYQRDALMVPAAIATATRAYFDGEDVIGQFLSEVVEVAPGYHVARAEIFRAFVAWGVMLHGGNNAGGMLLLDKRAIKLSDFKKYLENHGYISQKKAIGQCVLDVRLLKSAADFEDSAFDDIDEA